MLDLGLEAAAAERALDAAIRIKERLGADLLRAGTFGIRNDAERHRFTVARSLRQGLEDDVSHKPKENNSPPTRSRGRCLMAGPESGNRPATLSRTYGHASLSQA